MSYQNNSHNNGSNVKSVNGAKAGGTSKGSGAKGTGGTGGTKGKLSVKSGSHDHTVGQNKKVGGSFHAQDIKSLIHNQGKASLGGQEWSLKSPSWSDSTLQAIISDPKLTARPAGKPSADGRLTFELRGHGKTINITVGR